MRSWIIGMVLLSATPAFGATCKDASEFDYWRTDVAAVHAAGLRDGFISGVVVQMIREGREPVGAFERFLDWLMLQKGDSIALRIRDECEASPEDSLADAFTSAMVKRMLEFGVGGAKPEISL